MIAYPEIDPVAIAIGPLKIHWYGIMYLVAFTIAWFLALKQTKRVGVMQKDDVGNLISYAGLGVVVGGRAGYVLFYNFDKFLADPLWLFRIWQGGMSFHGGLIGVTIALILYARKLNQPVIKVFDFVGTYCSAWIGRGTHR